jgi:hypothetical protein
MLPAKFQGLEKKQLFLDCTSNPCHVILNSDAPGTCFNAHIERLSMNIPALNQTTYYQVDFGGILHREGDLSYGAVSSYVQVPNYTHTLNIPLKFYNNHVQQDFWLTLYGPGSNPARVVLGPGESFQLSIHYDYIPNL